MHNKLLTCDSVVGGGIPAWQAYGQSFTSNMGRLAEYVRVRKNAEQAYYNNLC